MKKIILLSLLATVGVFGLNQMAFAESAILSVFPASLNSTVGSSFNVLAQLNPANNKVCVVRGTVIFDNLSCRSITVASGLYALIAPTCANPNFLIGIPKCTTINQNILSASVRGVRAGKANLSIAAAKVIGTGTNIDSGLKAGTYNITAAKVVTATNVATVAQPEPEVAQEKSVPVQQLAEENNIPANVAVASLSSNGLGWFNYFLIALVAIIAIYAIYYFIKRKKK